MKSLNRYVLTDEIYTLLKEQLMTHQLAPGEKINIDRLARELEVSNIPVREALTRLVTEGLVRMVPFKGMFVTDISQNELDEIYEIRIELEPLAALKAAAGIPDDELAKLAESKLVWEAQDWRDNTLNLAFVSEMNDEVHGLILKYCDNKTLSRLIQMYIERIQRYLSYIHQELPAEIMRLEWREHERIISALLSRSGESAAEALRQHLRQSHKRTRAYFGSSSKD